MMTPFTTGSKVSFKEKYKSGLGKNSSLIGTGIIVGCDNDFTCGLGGLLYEVEILTCKDEWLDAGETIYLLHDEIKEILDERD